MNKRVVIMTLAILFLFVLLFIAFNASKIWYEAGARNRPYIPPTTTPYTCPKSGWMNCMPVLTEETKKLCTKEARAWYQTNCPNFQGVAE